MRLSTRFQLMLMITFCLMTTLADAQDDQPAPQFLYRDGNHLVLLDGYTGEATELPFEVADGDLFSWSPDGHYLLARLQDDENSGYCLNLYDVDKLTWAYDEPISCAVVEAFFSDDEERIYYTTDEKTNEALWVYSLEAEASRKLYRTNEGDYENDTGISKLQWSPTKTYLTFETYDWMLGGTLNSLVVMNVENETYTTLSASDTYYASYNPIWSADDRWFLVTLLEEYSISFSMPYTNQRGDLYLVNADTGTQYRLTYTPATQETDIHWTDDGNIAFGIITAQELTLEQAMSIEVVPPDEIVTPEPVDEEAYFGPLADVQVSPDPNLGAWVTPQVGNLDELKIGSIVEGERTPDFSISIPDSYQSDNILIGWRPSDYPYPQE